MSRHPPLQDNDRVSRIYWAGLGVICVLILYSCFSRQITHSGMEFRQIFEGGKQLLSGNWSFLYTDSLTPLYSPVATLPFSLFSFGDFSVARYIYAAFHALIAIALPAMLYTICKKENVIQSVAQKETFVMGVFVSFFGSLRFLDSEFHISHFGLWIPAAFLAAFFLWISFPHNRWWKGVASLLICLFAPIKIFGLLALTPFFFARNKRGRIFLGTVLFMLLPNPSLWSQYSEAFPRWLANDWGSVNLQGFSAFAVNHLKMNPAMGTTHLLWVPLYVLLVAFLWKSFQKQKLILRIFSCLTFLLLATMATPLATQAQYSILWILIPLSWALATTGERRWLVGVAILLGLSPKGVIGHSAALLFEQAQGVFLVALAALGLFAKQIRRMS